MEEIVKEMAINHVCLSIISTRPLKKLSDLFEVQHPFFSQMPDPTSAQGTKTDPVGVLDDGERGAEKERERERERGREYPTSVVDISKDPSRKMTAMMRGVVLRQNVPAKRPRLDGVCVCACV